MGINQSAYQELRARYNSAWTPPTTEFENEKVVKSGIWARFTITDGTENQISIGGDTNTFRIEDVLTIQLFASLESGCVTVLAKADSCADIFRNWCGAYVTCRAASVRKIGNDGLGWYQVNVIVPFKVDHLK